MKPENRSISRNNPWRDREVPHLPLKSVFLQSGLILLCAVYLATLFAPYTDTPVFTVVSLGVIIVCAINLITHIRAASVLVPPFCIVFFAYWMTNGQLTIPAICLCVLVIIRGGATLILLTKHRWLLLLLPLAAYPLALCTTLFNPLAALVSLICFPAAALLAAGTVRNLPRVSVICMVSAGIAIPLLAALMILFYKTYGGLTPELANRAMESLRATLLSNLQDTLQKAASATSASASSIPAANTLNTLISRFLNLIPGLFVVACNILAFFLQASLLAELRVLQMEPYLTPEAVQIRMSLTSGILLLLALPTAWIASSMGTRSGEAVAAVADNLAMVLEPGLALIGFGDLLQRIRKAQSGPFWLICLLMLICLSGSLILILIALWGAVSLILSAVRARKNNNQSRS